MIRIAIHGGAGAIPRRSMTSDQERDYLAVLDESLRAGYALLAAGESALDAAEQAVRVMEDSPLFNAGRGAVFSHEGRNEMDAAIMDGATCAAGAVAVLTRVRNPISGARAVLTQSPHVMLIGDGAERFLAEQGLELVDPAYFYTDYRWRQLQAVRVSEQAHLDHSVAAPAGAKSLGTVGAVALDGAGNLAAATSTGGMTNKRYGRVGDTPIIGAGTWADNRTCAVSCTGHGEYFMRRAAAHDVAARIAYQGQDLEAAAAGTLAAVATLGGEGGLIAIDAGGRVVLPFNSDGMYRGYSDDRGNPVCAIYREID